MSAPINFRVETAKRGAWPDIIAAPINFKDVKGRRGTWTFYACAYQFES